MHLPKYFSIAILCVTTWIVAPLVLGSPTEDSNERIILLTSRQVLRGEVALYGDRYLITQSHSEIRIPRERVDRICRNIEEAYLHLQHQIRFGSAGDHLRLSQWCLDEKMYDEARRQLEKGMLKRANHPRIDLIRRQLEAAKMIEDSPLKQKVFASQLSDPDELEAMAHYLPPETVESFTRTVQPLLLNSCGTRGCHGGGENQFTLHRSSRGQQLPRRLTLRNLQSVLIWIDRKNTAESPLLYFASTSHFPGKKTNTKKYPFAPDSLANRRLIEWLENFSDPAKRSLDPLPAEPSLNANHLVSAPPGTAGSLSLYSPSRATGKDQTATATATQLKRGKPVPPNAFRPRDPFDAEIFNRRHHPQMPQARH